MTSPPVLKLSQLRVGSSQAPILDVIDLELNAGHFLGIVGPNGAGKSTLLHAITGNQPVDAGHIELFGTKLRQTNRRRLLRNVGFLTQLHDHEPRLPLRVFDIVAMGMNEYTLPLWFSRIRKERVLEALSQVEMQAYALRDFRELSGGQRQRVRLARALVRHPKLLLLDEPSAALDTHGQNQLYQLLRKLCDEEAMTIVMVEHDIAAISAYVDSVACLNKKIHYHAKHGENIPEHVWLAMYGEHMHIVAHDSHCIGCSPAGSVQEEKP